MNLSDACSDCFRESTYLDLKSFKPASTTQLRLHRSDSWNKISSLKPINSLNNNFHSYSHRLKLVNRTSQRLHFLFLNFLSLEFNGFLYFEFQLKLSGS